MVFSINYEKNKLFVDFEKYKIHLINNFLQEYKDLYSERSDHKLTLNIN